MPSKKNRTCPNSTNNNHPAIRGQNLYNACVIRAMKCPLPITNQYRQFSSLTLMSIFIMNR